MIDVAILGAGELGALVAHVVARRNAAGSVRLIDDAVNVAAGKALDIAQAASIEQFAAAVTGASDVASAAGASVIVVADRVGGGEWQGEEGLQLLKRLNGFAPNAIVLCAGAAQRELVERGVRELHLTRTRLFGSAPEALVAASRAIVALETHRSVRDVALCVAGVPPDHIVIPWEHATVGGFAATRLLNEPSLRRIDDRIRRLWPPGPYALASAAAKIVEAIGGRSRSGASCFVAPDDALGRRSRAAALPVRLGRAGILDVVVPELSAHDRVALENAMLL
jgi:malate dehydrogenase